MAKTNERASVLSGFPALDAALAGDVHGELRPMVFEAMEALGDRLEEQRARIAHLEGCCYQAARDIYALAHKNTALKAGERRGLCLN